MALTPLANNDTGLSARTKINAGLTAVDAVVLATSNVNNTSDANKPVSAVQQAALDLKAPLASPAFTGTPTGITKTHVGLGNVDNTADTAKPVSTAQQTALDLKAPLASPAFTGTPTGITKTHVGLGNVDNTADTAKPVSTAQQTALNLKVNTTRSVLAGGIATGGGTLAGDVTITVPKASAVETGAGTDDTKAVTPLGFKTAMDAAITQRVLKGTTLTAFGLVTGGGDLSNSRTFTVTASSDAQALAGVDTTTAMTPASTKAAIAAQTTILKRTARRILTAAQRTGLNLPSPMTTPPTLSMSAHNAATTITGGVAVPAMTAGAFTYLGSVPRLHTAYTTDFYYPGAVTRTTAPTYRGGAMRVRFGYGGRYLDIRLLGASSLGKTYRVWVDGQPTALTPKTDLLGTSQNQRLIIDFGSYATRLVEIDIDQWAEFGGVTREKDYDVYAIDDAGPRIMGVGDSYFDGTGADSFITGMFLQAAKRLGLPDAWNQGEGGLGYVDDGSSLLTAIQKLPLDVTPYAPDWIVLALGINDDDKVAATVQTAVTAYVTALLTALPNCGVTMLGPWRAPTLNPPTPVLDAVKAGAQAHAEYGARLLYVDTITENWQQIAGYQGALSGTGNSNVYIGTDGTHPVQAGHDYLGQRIAAAVVRHAKMYAQ